MISQVRWIVFCRQTNSNLQERQGLRLLCLWCRVRKLKCQQRFAPDIIHVPVPGCQGRQQHNHKRNLRSSLTSTVQESLQTPHLCLGRLQRC